MIKIKRYEFWSPKIFNLPFYFYLGFKCLINGVSLKGLLKANSYIKCGDLRASKFEIQNLLGEKYFPKTVLLKKNLSNKVLIEKIENFVKENSFPIIAKPDTAECGKGTKLIRNKKDITILVNAIEADYIIQEYIDLPLEYGVFYIRYKGESKIVGINGKYFPSLVGDGKSTIWELVKDRENFSNHWHTFLRDFDLNKIPKKDEKIRLSHIGSHTLGCVFTDEIHLITPKLKKSFLNIMDSFDDLNYGRVDLRAKSEEDFKNGKFKFIEVNGITSLPTQMFDSSYSIFKAYKTFFEFGDYLVKIAKENKHKKMEVENLNTIFKKIGEDTKCIERTHKKLMK